MYRMINPPQRRCCPSCKALGFRRIGFNFHREPVYQCHSCFHEWEDKCGKQQGTKVIGR